MGKVKIVVENKHEEELDHFIAEGLKRTAQKLIEKEIKNDGYL
jgi:hypothetical protein